MLDLFAGSGALGLEALSRGAAHATFVEIARASLKSLEENVASLGAQPRVSIVKGDAAKFVGRLGPAAFDLALADPPYGQGHAAALLERFGEAQKMMKQAQKMQEQMQQAQAANMKND